MAADHDASELLKTLQQYKQKHTPTPPSLAGFSLPTYYKQCTDLAPDAVECDPNIPGQCPASHLVPPLYRNAYAGREEDPQVRKCAPRDLVKRPTPPPGNTEKMLRNLHTLSTHKDELEELSAWRTRAPCASVHEPQSCRSMTFAHDHSQGRCRVSGPDSCEDDISQILGKMREHEHAMDRIVHNRRTIAQKLRDIQASLRQRESLHPHLQGLPLGGMARDLKQALRAGGGRATLRSMADKLRKTAEVERAEHERLKAELLGLRTRYPHVDQPRSEDPGSTARQLQGGGVRKAREYDVARAHRQLLAPFTRALHSNPDGSTTNTSDSDPLEDFVEVGEALREDMECRTRTGSQASCERGGRCKWHEGGCWGARGEGVTWTWRPASTPAEFTPTSLAESLLHQLMRLESAALEEASRGVGRHLSDESSLALASSPGSLSPVDESGGVLRTAQFQSAPATISHAVRRVQDHLVSEHSGVSRAQEQMQQAILARPIHVARVPHGGLSVREWITRIAEIAQDSVVRVFPLPEPDASMYAFALMFGNNMVEHQNALARCRGHRDLESVEITDINDTPADVRDSIVPILQNAVPLQAGGPWGGKKTNPQIAQLQTDVAEVLRELKKQQQKPEEQDEDPGGTPATSGWKFSVIECEVPLTMAKIRESATMHTRLQEHLSDLIKVPSPNTAFLVVPSVSIRKSGGEKDGASYRARGLVVSREALPEEITNIRVDFPSPQQITETITGGVAARNHTCFRWILRGLEALQRNGQSPSKHYAHLHRSLKRLEAMTGLQVGMSVDHPGWDQVVPHPLSCDLFELDSPCEGGTQQLFQARRRTEEASTDPCEEARLPPRPAHSLALTVPQVRILSGPLRLLPLGAKSSLMQGGGEMFRVKQFRSPDYTFGVKHGPGAPLPVVLASVRSLMKADDPVK